MKYFLFFLFTACPFLLLAQITTKSQGSNNSAGRQYVAPVVTKTYKEYKAPAAPSPTRSSTSSRPNAPTPTSYSTTGGRRDESGLPEEKAERVTIHYDSYGKEDANNNYRPVQLKGKWGYIGRDQIQKIAVKYDEVKFTSQGLYGVRVGKKWGFVDFTGRVRVPIELDELVTGFAYSKAQVIKGGVTIFINTEGKDLTPVAAKAVVVNGIEYRSVRASGEGRHRAESWYGNKYGYLDDSGRVAIPLIYEEVSYLFNEGLAAAQLKGKWGFINNAGKVLIPFIYEERYIGFSGDRAAVKLNGKWGYINKAGKIVVTVSYDAAEDYVDGLAKVSRNGRWGFIDLTGKEIVPVKYDLLYGKYEGYYKGKLAGKWGFLDSIGNVMVGFEWDEVIKDFDKNGRVTLRKGKQSEILDRKDLKPLQASGENVIFYEEKGSYYAGLAKVSINKKYGFIDEKGKEVIPLLYDDAQIFINGFAQVKSGKKYGYIDKTGKVVIPLIYESTGYSINDNSIGVKINDKWGIIDTKGKTIIAATYEAAESFSEGLAAVKLNGKWGYVDKLGKQVIPFKYGKVGSFKGGVAAVKAGGWGFVNNKGKEIVPAVYDDMYSGDGYFSEGKLHVEKNGTSYYFDSNGNSIVLPDPKGNFTDAVEGKRYNTIHILKQTWLAENLNTSHFRNGDSIPELKTAAEWKKAGEEGRPGWCYYRNNPFNSKYGKLYNGYVVSDPRGLAPVGFHIATDEEWTMLTKPLYKGAASLKAQDSWADYYYGNNELGFAAIPAGKRNGNGEFENQNIEANWWCAFEAGNTTSQGWVKNIFYTRSTIDKASMGKAEGFSIRCVKD
ncbi:MAG: repeat-containing protein [Segetibacter sp.]|nr:repeat-containing protein [Segetibacter sp.]